MKTPILRTLSVGKLKRLSLNALLDDKQATCTAVVDELSRRLAAGRKTLNNNNNK